MSKKENKTVKRIKQIVATDIDIYRRNITSSIIELCRETGIKDAYYINFTQIIMMHSTKPKIYKGKRYGFVTETTICNMIAWREHCDFIHVGLNGEWLLSSSNMTLDELYCVYSEMLNVVNKTKNA